jgi:TPR repeat protein
MKLCILIVIFSILAGGCATKESARSKGISSSDVFNLESKELLSLKSDANDGNKNAAFRVSQFYTFTEKNEKEEIYWLTRAAKLGHPTAQYNLAYLLTHRKSIRDLDAAEMWLNAYLINPEMIPDPEWPDLPQSLKEEIQKQKTPNQALQTISSSVTVAAEPLCVPPHEMSDLKR